MAGIVVTKVIREPMAIELVHGGQTIGQMIDDRLVEMVRDGDKCQSVLVEFSETEWNMIARNGIGAQQKQYKR